jgi:hypothetical protein
LRSRWQGRACLVVIAIAIVPVIGVLGDARRADAKPSALTPAEQANSGEVTYEQLAETGPECSGAHAEGVERVHFKIVFSGSKSLKVVSLDVPNDKGNVYKRTKWNVWGKVYDDGGRVVITFRRDGMTLQSFNSDESPCITYTRTLVKGAS